MSKSHYIPSEGLEFSYNFMAFFEVLISTNVFAKIMSLGTMSMKRQNMSCAVLLGFLNKHFGVV